MAFPEPFFPPEVKPNVDYLVTWSFQEPWIVARFDSESQCWVTPLNPEFRKQETPLRYHLVKDLLSAQSGGGLGGLW